MILAGAVAAFRGMAFGFDGEPLTGARYLWNFGDGAVQEGKNLTHIFHFPGTYRVNLLVSSGEYAGSDWLTVRVVPPEIYVSEVRPGKEGFVELFNASPDTLDIGGLSLTDEKKNTFRVPLLTSIAKESPLVFSNVITALDPEKSLVLRDARAAILNEAGFGGILPPGASFEKRGPDFIVNLTSTPGSFEAGDFGGAGAASRGKEKISAPRPSTASSTLKTGAGQEAGNLSQGLLIPPPAAGPGGQPEQNAPAAGANHNLAGPAFASHSGKTFVFAALAVSLAGALAFVALKRKML